MVTVVGRCIGAGEKEQAKKYARNLVLLAYASIITMSTIIVILLPQIVGLYNLPDASSDLGRQLILIHTFNVCTIWPMSFTLPNAFRAVIFGVRYIRGTWLTKYKPVVAESN